MRKKIVKITRNLFASKRENTNFLSDFLCSKFFLFLLFLLNKTIYEKSVLKWLSKTDAKHNINVTLIKNIFRNMFAIAAD